MAVAHRIIQAAVRSTSDEEGWPLVSIVIPVFNRELLIAEALHSAFAQDYSNYEIVICDNHSEDGTLPKVLSLCAGLTHVTIIAQDSNVGPVKNWRTAISYARGDYIKLLFSDDELLPGCLSAMVSVMDDSIAYVYASCLIGISRSQSSAAYLPIGRKPLTPCFQRSPFGLLKYALQMNVPVSPCAALFRRDLLLRSLDESIRRTPSDVCLSTGAGPDVKLYIDALRSRPKYCHIPDPLVFFRAHSGSFTIGSNLLVRNSYACAYKYYWSESPLYLRFAFALHPLVKAFDKLSRMYRSF